MTATLLPPIATSAVTPEQLLSIEDSVAFELIDGTLKERSASVESSRIGLRIGWLLGNEAERTGTAEVYGCDLGYQCFPNSDDPKWIRKPDVSVIRRDRLAALKGDVGYMPIVPDLAVEVLSPNKLVQEINEKVEDYLAAGFALVWIVDPHSRVLQIFRGDGSTTRIRNGGEITGENVLPNFRCTLADLLGPPTTGKIPITTQKRTEE